MVILLPVIFLFNSIVMTTHRPLLLETVQLLKNPPLCKVARTNPSNKFRTVCGWQTSGSDNTEYFASISWAIFVKIQ